MADQSSHTRFRKFLDRIRAESPLMPHVFITALSALIVLRWADFQDAELEAMAVFDGEPYEPVLPGAMHWRAWYDSYPEILHEFLTDRLPCELSRFGNAPHNPMAAHLSRLPFALEPLKRLPVQRLADLVRLLAELPFETPSDRRQVLELLDYVLESFQDRHSGDAGTPSAIARLMAMLASPAPGERVYDPCFGSGGLLTAAIDEAITKMEPGRVRYAEPVLSVTGVELNPSAYLIGLTRLVLSGIDDPRLELADSLARAPMTGLGRNGFDVVLADPPWGWKAKLDNRYGLEHYPVMTQDGTGLFIQHTMAHLRPEGRAVIAVPYGLLFRGGADQKLRRWLLENHTVEAVIALPETAFLPLTSIKSSLLVIRRGGQTRRVRMVNAEPFFEKGKNRKPADLQDHKARTLVTSIHSAAPAEWAWDVDENTLTETGYDLTPQRRNLSTLDAILTTLRNSMDVLRLKDCCRVTAGRSIPSADLSETSYMFEHALDPEYENLAAIPYIRIKDIKHGEAAKSSMWISPQASTSISANWKLRAGDILFSKSGTLGKTGVVRNGAVGAVASGSFYVLSPDRSRIDVHYLAAYLDSADCKAWIRDRASGSVISHINRKTIEDVPVPLPPLQIQHRIATEWREHKVDALDYLAQLYTDRKQDPIVEWLDEYLKTIHTDQLETAGTLDFSRLDYDILPIISARLDGLSNESVLRRWFKLFYRAFFLFRNIHHMPPGPSLFSVIQESIQLLEKSKNGIEGHMPNEGKARKVTDHFIQILNRGAEALLSAVELVFSINEPFLRAGKPQDIVLAVHNNSLLPLRDVKIATQPEWGRFEINYLSEKTIDRAVLKGEAPANITQVMLRISWSALTLNGRTINGTQEIALGVSDEPEEKEKTIDLGPSPYVCGDPIRPKRNDVFFGREELLGQIRRQVERSGNVILLEGNRRAGKSSILMHLEGSESIPGWLAVYCSLQGAEGSRDRVGVSTADVFREIASAIAKALTALNIETPLPDGSSIRPGGKKLGIAKACRKGIDDEAPFNDFRDYIETVLDGLDSHDLGILLMLDEFDKLQEGIDNGVTSPQVPENIRYMVQTYPKFSAILTGSRRLKRMREEYWSALFGLGTRFGVSALASDAAARLVTEPVKGRLTYSREAVERVIYLTHGQPYLLQCLCNRIFDMASQLKIRSVTLELVDKAGILFAEDNEHFATLWDYVRSDRRRFLLGLIHREAEAADRLRLGFLMERLSESGIEVDDKHLIEDLEDLKELELIDKIEQTGNSHYVLSIPLMGRWIDRQYDFEALKKKAQIETEDAHD